MPDSRIEQEALSLIHKQINVLIFGTLFASTMIFIVLQGILPDSVLYAWLAFAYASCALRYLLNRIHYDQASTRAKRARFFIGALVTGLVWGSISILGSTADDPFALSILTIAVACLAAAAIAGLSSIPMVYYAFLIPSMAGMSIGFLNYDIDGNLLLFFASIVYIFALAFFCRNINRTTVDAIRLRFENEDLVSEVKSQALRAEKANIDKSRFLAAASHDLRQPFHALSLFVSSIDEESLDSKTLGAVNNIKSSTSALELMFTELLDVSRLDAGAVEAVNSHFTAGDLLDSILPEFRTLAKDKGLELHCHYGDEVIHSDLLLCERILRNILSNAVNYTEQGSIQVETSRTGNGIAISVSDTGIGIAAEKHEQVFSEFEQLQNPERDRNKGLGLGLAIVKKLCDLLDLDIALDSEPGTGSTFTITFPEGDGSLVSREKEEQDLSPLATMLANVRVLVIDDDQMVLEGMRLQLEKWKCQGVYATGFEDAVPLVEQEDLDLIICDYRLRDAMTGVEVVHGLNGLLAKPLPSIIITGDTDPEIIKSILESSDSLVLHKPIQGSKLRMAMSSLL